MYLRSNFFHRLRISILKNHLFSKILGDKELTDKLLLSAQKVEEIASKEWNITRNRMLVI